ncbi:transcriptional regulator [Pseudomaricurvus alkylphenolicus]|nr:transcriptional regulator [Pseudomaricurvus alkylphenolicus]
MLRILIENRHRVVMKDELMATIWKDRVVSDSAISSRIKSARQAIDDNGKSQKWIKTVHGLGFRFIGDIQDIATERTGWAGCDPRLDATEPRSDVSSLTDEDRPTIVVLPFQMSDTEKDTILSLGLAHDIITSLSRLRWLKVIARASAFQLSDTSITQSDIHALVNAKYCVSGFLVRHRTAVEINIRLDDVSDQTVIWAETISFRHVDVYQIRQELIHRISNQLELQISEHEARHAMLKSTDDINAWEAYHRAISHLFRFNEQDNHRALELFQQSIRLDPDFARAHAGLSSAAFQNAFNRYPGVDRLKAVELAINHAEKSIDLDHMDPLANFVRGRVHWLTGEPGASLPWLERAITLNPNYAQGYYAHGLASLLSSDDLRGYQDSETALTLSPLDPFSYGFYGIRAFSFLADDDRENAHIWAEKSAHQPGALAIMDLLAAATSDITHRPDRANAWLHKARERSPHIDSQQFFAALPFVSGQIREALSTAFRRLRI